VALKELSQRNSTRRIAVGWPYVPRLLKNDGIIMRKALGVLIVLALSLLVGWWLVQ
jgi:hypothetical protein